MWDCERRVLCLNLGGSAARLALTWFFELLGGSYEDILCIFPSCLRIRFLLSTDRFDNTTCLRKEILGSQKQALQASISSWVAGTGTLEKD
jgi:hypothetical protein